MGGGNFSRRGKERRRLGGIFLRRVALAQPIAAADGAEEEQRVEEKFTFHGNVVIGLAKFPAVQKRSRANKSGEPQRGVELSLLGLTRPFFSH